MRLIDADALIKYANNSTVGIDANDIARFPRVDAVPVVRCGECRWWDKIGDSPIGYCHACKHGYCSSNWEISIRRIHKEDFYCADGERKDGCADNG